MVLKVLICGEVVVAERFPVLRTTSAQIDLRGQGIEAVKRMGLIDAVRRRLVDEAGVSLINTKGNVEATILVGADGQGLHIRRNSLYHLVLQTHITSSG
ncbi:Monooxygenase [Penicillium verrucosum]|uniref:Monooxygenase n=1 Tax=Penicillium verrucosum TaxID=60171 RepID=UPI002544E38B|nr:Monooxygenase [Penicillium verrucosum]KAJ5943771.1 Monooxygenase [Penicillium verrucosum]